MSSEPNLFSVAAIADFKYDVVTVEKLTYDHFITIEGKKYNLEDLVDDINSIGNDIYWSDSEPVGDLFMKLGILSYKGNGRWCARATPGPNLEKFHDIFTKELEKARKSVK